MYTFLAELFYFSSRLINIFSYKSIISIAIAVYKVHINIVSDIHDYISYIYIWTGSVLCLISKYNYIYHIEYAIK